MTLRAKKGGPAWLLRLVAAVERRRTIKDAYERAYGKRRGLGEEFAGWEDQCTWPAERR